MSDMQDRLIDVANFVPASVVPPDAWIGHLPFAVWLIKLLKPDKFLELGTHSGNSYFSFCQAVREKDLSTKCYAVDTWEGEEHTGFYGEEVFQQVNDHNQMHFSAFSRLLRMKFDDASSYFSDGSIDLLHIDGLHTYEAVRHDFETWLPKLAPGAVVLFHDTNVQERGFGVWKFWEELKEYYPNNLEFIHSNGLGVLQINGGIEEKKLQWLQPSSPMQKKLKDYFSAIGSRQIERFELHQLRDFANSLNQELSGRDEQINSLNQSVYDKDVHINNLDGQIAALNQAVAERDGQIAELNQINAGQDVQIATLKQSIEARGDQINSLNDTLTERDRAINDLNQSVYDKDVHINNLDRQIAALAQEVSALRHSKSWKLSAPLRWSFYQLTLAKKILTAAQNALIVSGGFRPAMAKACRIYRNEGLRGLKRGFLSVHTHSEANPIISPDNFDRNDYQEWVRRYDTLDDNSRQRIKDKIAEFSRTPKISVVMPVYDPPLEFLDEAIWSVRNQLYPNWELCIADDASKNEDVRDLLKRHAMEDERIKVVYRANNGHISAASNSALEMVTGEFVALLDNDDLLPEHTLFLVAQTVLCNPDVGLIYSDEDKITNNGNRYAPYFKCELNPELLLSQNMISHLGCYRLKLLEEIGGFRIGFEGSQDYDLVLRVLERLSPEQVKHIPRILYHWRAIDGSTALATEEKNYAVEAGRKAVYEHLKRIGIQAEVDPSPEVPTMNRVRFALPIPEPFISIIIPTRDHSNLLSTCVNSILDRSTYLSWEIIIVDNGSIEPDTEKFFKCLPSDRIKVIRNDLPFNFPRLNNFAAREARGDILCLMNNDIEILSHDWIEEMASFACRQEIGCVGARLWYPDGLLQHGGVLLGVGGVANHAHYREPRGSAGYFGRAVLHQSFSAVTAACLMIRRNLYEEMGGLDETLAVAFNDVDFCLRVREAGYRNVWTPYAEMIHHESFSRGADDTSEKHARFVAEVHKIQERWGGKLQSDPAYNANLTLDHEDFSLAWPPRVEPI